MRLILLALLGALAACAGDPLNEGVVLFNGGDYSAAEASLAKIQDSDYRKLTEHDKAAYCLYRGLAIGAALGDKSAAAAWLGRAKEIEEQHPWSMSSDDKARLRKAERTYGPLPLTGEPALLPGD
jgi:hypothetical protein